MCVGGCCGGGCGQLDCFGKLLYIIEKVTMYLACSVVTTWIVLTVMLSIGVGVGIGYNYSFIDQNTNVLDHDISYGDDETSPGNENSEPKQGLRKQHVRETDAVLNYAINDVGTAPFAPVTLSTKLASILKLGPPKIPIVPEEKQLMKSIDLIPRDNYGVDDDLLRFNLNYNKDVERVNAKAAPSRRGSKTNKPLKPREKNKRSRSSTLAMPTLLIPLQGSRKLLPLISKILGEKKNVTLQFITI